MMRKQLVTVAGRVHPANRRTRLPLLDVVDDSAGSLQGVLLAAGLGASLWAVVVVVLLAATR